MKMKFLALVCAVTMVMGASLTAFAAGSSGAGSVAAGDVAGGSSATEAPAPAPAAPATPSIEVGGGSQVIGEGSRVGMPAVTTVDGGTVTAVDSATFQEAVKEATNAFGANTFVASIVDINVPNATFPYDLTIKNPNIWAGQNVTVLHKVNGSWERLTPKAVGDNTITVTVNSFSPFALVVDTNRSPKTMDIALMVGGLAGLFAAGTALTGKKKED